MKYIHVLAAFAIVLALVYAPVRAQTEGMESSDDDNDKVWKRIAIILPIVFGGITLLILLWYCCCRAPNGGGWGCGECNCGSCCGGAYGDYPGCRCHDGSCCGCQGGCGGGECCGAAPGRCCMCPGCHGSCGDDCGNCGGGCRGCGCDNCCYGCCPDGSYAGNQKQVVYSSSRGPMVYGGPPRIQVEDAYVYRSQPLADAGYTSPYTSNLAVNQQDRYNAYGSGGGYRPGGYAAYSGPAASGGGCGCGR